MQSITIRTTFSSDLAKAKEEIRSYVKQLHTKTDKPSLPLRLIEVDNIIEAYVEATGERPDSFELYGLGGYILADYLGDQYKHHRKDEHPFQTDNRVKKNHARHRTSFMEDTN
jgi:hypothetical protein